jgi:hypothetical protein
MEKCEGNKDISAKIVIMYSRINLARRRHREIWCKNCGTSIVSEDKPMKIYLKNTKYLFGRFNHS